MKISYKGDYALKVILDLTNSYPDNLVHIEDIASRQDIPQKFLEQILLQLKRGGFVQSKKGPNGGYLLSRPPENIILGDVVRFIDGPIFPISCIDKEAPKTCDEVSRCIFSSVWKNVSLAISEIIDNKNFKDLKIENDKLLKEQAITYYI